LELGTSASGYKWEDNVKINLRETAWEGVDWNQLP
jgi:hypothetical protein